MICFRASKSEPPPKGQVLPCFCISPGLAQPYSPHGLQGSTTEQAAKHSQGSGTLWNKAGCKAKAYVSEVTAVAEDCASTPQNVLWYPGRLLAVGERWLWDRGTMKKRFLELLLTLCGTCTVKRQNRAALGPGRASREYSREPLGLEFSSPTP